MLRKISGPCSIYIHEDGVYVFEGARHDVGLQCFSAVTRPLPVYKTAQPDVDRTQAIIIDGGQAAHNPVWHQRPAAGSKAREWFAVELIRLHDGDWVADGNNEWRSELVHITEKSKKRRTSDVLGGDHDEDLVVPAAHEKVVEDLEKKVSVINPALDSLNQGAIRTS